MGSVGLNSKLESGHLSVLIVVHFSTQCTTRFCIQWRIEVSNTLCWFSKSGKIRRGRCGRSEFWLHKLMARTQGSACIFHLITTMPSTCSHRVQLRYWGPQIGHQLRVCMHAHTHIHINTHLNAMESVCNATEQFMHSTVIFDVRESLQRLLRHAVSWIFCNGVKQNCFLFSLSNSVSLFLWQMAHHSENAHRQQTPQTN